MPGGRPAAGMLHLEQRDYQAAEGRFLALTQAPGTKHDAYALLGLATLNFTLAPADRRKARPCLCRRNLTSVLWFGAVFKTVPKEVQQVVQAEAAT